MLAFYEIRSFYRRHDPFLELSGDEDFILILFEWLLEQQDAIVLDQEFKEILLLGLEQAASIIRQVAHFYYLTMIICWSKIALGPVDNHAHTIFNIFECLEGFQ